MDRRTVLAGLVSLGACAPRPRRIARQALLRDAIAAAGGTTALSRVAALRWTGEARIHAADRTLDIGVRTRVVPFTAARSDSWLLSEGPSALRSMIIERDGGWIERGGVRSPMPAPMLAHERQQYAIYGLMLLAPLLGPAAAVELAPDNGDCLVARHAKAPVTTLCFGPDRRLAGAENRVPAPEGAGEIAQRFAFGGRLESAGVVWPQTMSIDQDGRRFFELRLSSFAVEAAPGR